MMRAEQIERERAFSRRQRTAWLVLIGSFTIFCVIAIAVPLFVNSYLQNAKRPLSIIVQANQGTVGIDDPDGTRRAVLVGEPGLAAEAGARVRTDNTATAVLLVTPPDMVDTLARLQVYSNSTFDLQQADLPRFSMSHGYPALTLYLENGRLRVSIPEQRQLPILATIQTPHGEVTLTHTGQYYLVVTNNDTQVTVQDGRATLISSADKLVLTSDQRGRIATGQPPEGPLGTERNLIVNGDFSEGMDNWVNYTWSVELAEQPEGQTDVVNIAGEPTLKFFRQGAGHADTKVRQIINGDVTDYESIQMLLTFRIVDQSLGVCGINGSECPLFVRVNYIDDTGTQRSWRQGFYASGEVVVGETPDACVTCAGAIAQRAHYKVPLGQIVFYEVDLRNELARLGAWPIRYIESITLEASGHSFDVEVLDVALNVDLTSREE